jgi:hypothetical protein
MWEVAEPRDDRDAARDVARGLAEVAAMLASVKAEATAWLSDPSYDVLRFRLEEAHSVVEAATVEARRRVRLNEQRER